MEKKSTRGGAILIAEGVLHGLLHLPESYTIRGTAKDVLRNVLVVYVESDELPEVEEGTMLPIVRPTYTKDQWGQIHLLGVDVET